MSDLTKAQSPQETLPATGPGISGTGSSNPVAIAAEKERLEKNKGSDVRSPEARTATMGTTGSQPKASEGIFVKDENNTVLKQTHDEKTGVVTTVSALNEEEAEKTKKLTSNLPVVENLTQSKEGVPGNTNLTMDGTLQGDKSARSDRSIEDLNQEEEDKSGPNPIPNREGNEITKAANALSASGPNLMFGINRQTNQAAEKIRGILKNNKNLSEEDKIVLNTIAKQLELTGRM